MAKELADQWDFYMCRVNDKPAVINLNLRARTQEGQTKRPQLLWMFFDIQNPREDGLHRKEEAETIYAIEDVVQRAVPKEVQFVGRIATDGRREMYFYGPEGIGLETWIRGAMRTYPTYRWQVGGQLDNEWRQYRDVLYPTPTDLQVMGNRSVLYNMQKQGDTLEKPREVTHWVHFPEGGRARSFADATRPIGYRVEEHERAPDAAHAMRFLVRLSRVDSVQQAEIDRVTLELFELAQKHGGEYDGWEAQVLKGM